MSEIFQSDWHFYKDKNLSKKGGDPIPDGILTKITGLSTKKKRGKY